MTTYYTEKDGRIDAYADWAFDPAAIETDRAIVHGPDGKLYFEDEAPAVQLTPEEIYQMLVDLIQGHLDAFARTRNYDGILSAASYATSGNARFRAEGQYAVEARDATWAKAYAVLDEVSAGARGIPTAEELLAELPVLAWPE